MSKMVGNLSRFYSGIQEFSCDDLTNPLVLAKKSDECREALLGFDRSLVEEEGPETVDLEELSILNDGRFSVRCYDTVYQCFYHHKGRKPLYVFLNGSKVNGYPEFKRWSWYPFIDGNVLNIADPMYSLYPDMKLGWYWGYGDSDEGDFRLHISKIVKKIFKISQSTKIIFYASSGGCAGAIHAAERFRDCTVVSINPQLVLDDYPGKHLFTDYVDVNLSEKDPRSRENLIPFVTSGRNRHIVIQNIRSNGDMVQYNHLCTALGITPGYGVIRSESVISWTYDGPGDNPHNAQENYCIFHAIDYMVHNFDDMDGMERLYLLFNEFWYNTLKSKMKKNKGASSSGFVVTAPKDDEVKVLKPSEDPYNHMVLLDSLEPHSYYRLHISNSSSVIGVFDSITVAIIEKGKVLMEQGIPLGEKVEIEFKTEDMNSKRSLVVFPDSPGISDGLSLKMIYSLTVFPLYPESDL